MTSFPSSQYVFGIGSLTLQPVGGGASVPFSSIEDISVDISGDMKGVSGQYQFNQAVARGKIKIQCKAVVNNMDVALFNQSFFNQTVITGTLLPATNEAHAIPGSSSYTVTVTNAAAFAQDMGVTYAGGPNAGRYLQQVASAPAQGQYSVAAGVYTFAAADASVAIYISYLYTATTGRTLAITNQLMGLAPTFQATLTDSFNNQGSVQSMVMQLFACTSSKLSMPLKAEDFMKTQIEWECQANSAGQVLNIYTSN